MRATVSLKYFFVVYLSHLQEAGGDAEVGAGPEREDGGVRVGLIRNEQVHAHVLAVDG